ncbi:MAG: restriction endonuclease subunit S [Acetomicrobium sp.]|nr:restriction endonuclease subunit S [Acetomicrobium sp.]
MDEVADVREQEHEDMANLSEGFKMTELGPLPEDWRVVAFSEAVLNERFGVGKVRQQEYQKAGRFPIVDQGQKLIAGYWDRLEDVYQGPLPVIIFGDHSRVFKFVDFPFVCGADGTKILVPDISKFFPAFLYFALTRLEIPNRGYNRHFSLLREQRLPCPPLPEQRAIAHVLRTVQRAKEATERVIQATQELKKSLMYYLFTYGSVPIEEAEKVPLKETEIGLVPEHWEVVRLGEVATVKYGKARPKTQGNVPVIGSGGIYGWTATSLVDFPTLVIGRKGTAGEVWLVECPCWPSDTTFYLDWKKRVNVRFLFNYLHSNKPSGEHAKTTLPSLQRHDVEALLIPFPPLLEQGEICLILRAVDKKLQAEEARKQALEALFKSLLNNLMTGKIRVKDVVLPNVGEGKGDVTH